MTHTTTIKTQTSPMKRMLAVTTAGLALFAGDLLISPQIAHADDCILDTNDDGNADSNTDTDGGADSAGSDSRLACGVQTRRLSVKTPKQTKHAPLRLGSGL